MWLLCKRAASAVAATKREDDIDRRTRSVIYRQASRTISKAHLPSGGAEEDYADWVDVGDGVHKLILEVNSALIIWTNVCLEEWEERAVWVESGILSVIIMYSSGVDGDDKKLIREGVWV